MQGPSNEVKAAVDTMGLAYAVLDRWAGRLAVLDAELEGEAVYDEDSHEPLNDAAKLQTSVAIIATEFLQPAVSLARRLSSEFTYKPAGTAEDDRATDKITPTEKVSA